ERTIEAVGPEMSAGFRIDQLPSDAHPAAAFAHRAFEHIAHAHFTADLLHIDRLSLVREARIARDHEEPADARQGRDDLLDHAVHEIFLFRVAAHVLERQHRDRRLVGQWQTSRWDRRLAGMPAGGRPSYTVDPHRSGDVFQLLF